MSFYFRAQNQLIIHNVQCCQALNNSFYFFGYDGETAADQVNLKMQIIIQSYQVMPIQCVQERIFYIGFLLTHSQCLSNSHKCIEIVFHDLLKTFGHTILGATNKLGYRTHRLYKSKCSICYVYASY